LAKRGERGKEMLVKLVTSATQAPHLPTIDFQVTDFATNYRRGAGCAVTI
jgi:hypothetical protein